MITEYWWLSVTVIGVIAIYFVWGRKFGSRPQEERAAAK
jgi:hypothetical protein